MRRRKITSLDARRGCRVRDQLTQIAPVRAHGVRGRVTVKPEKLQKVFEVLVHRPTPEGRPARARRAPGSSAFFRPSIGLGTTLSLPKGRLPRRLPAG